MLSWGQLTRYIGIRCISRAVGTVPKKPPQRTAKTNLYCDSCRRARCYPNWRLEDPMSLVEVCAQPHIRTARSPTRAIHCGLHQIPSICTSVWTFLKYGDAQSDLMQDRRSAGRGCARNDSQRVCFGVLSPTFFLTPQSTARGPAASY